MISDVSLIGATFIFRICMKYIGRAIKTLQDLPPEQISERELSVLEILLLKNDNPKIAATMAIDMMTAGIDTVISFI